MNVDEFQVAKKVQLKVGGKEVAKEGVDLVFLKFFSQVN